MHDFFFALSADNPGLCIFHVKFCVLPEFLPVIIEVQVLS